VAPSTQSHVVKFGVFEVDLEAGELRKSGVRLKLVGQPFQVLQLLLERPQEVVTREELRQRLWPDETFVDYDLALKRIINRLREVLGDSAESPRFIETIPRRGYRFIAAVNGNGAVAHSAEDDLEAAKTAETRRSRLDLRIKWVLGLGVVALLLAVLGLGPKELWQRIAGKNAVPQIRSLAVLPLQNLSADPTQEYFSDGMTDALITNLAQIGSLKVISRTSSMQYKQARKSLPEIARELNVDGIIEGTVQRSGDRVRITAQLIYARTDKHMWAQSYERDARDVFALQREVTEDIASRVQERLTRENSAPLTGTQRVDVKVLDAYFLGNYHLGSFGKGAGDEERKTAAKYFQQSIDADPNFAPAYNGLANSHLSLLWPSSEDAEIAAAAAKQAATLDPDLADVHRTLGDLDRGSWNWSAAENEYRRAIAIDPNNAEAHDSLGHLLDTTGRVDEGWNEQQLAQELDPNHNHLSDALALRNQHDRAITMLQMLLKRYPDDAYLHLGLYNEYLTKQMYSEAMVHANQLAILFGTPQVAAEARRAEATSGPRAALRTTAKAWEHLVATHQVFAPVNIAELYVALGDKERAFYWLEHAYAHHDMAIAGTGLGLEWLNTEVLLDPLRSDPRFQNLIRRVGLPELRIDEAGSGRRTVSLSK